MTLTQPGLFDPTQEGRKAAYFVTNRHNLMRIQAARMLMPFSGFATKHYRDFLQVCPGRVPLFDGAIAGAVAKMVILEVPDIPVLVEVHTEMLAIEPVPSLLPDGKEWMNGVGFGGALCWAGGGCVSSSVIAAIHLQSDSDRSETAVREFDDVPAFDGLLRVTPELFVDSAPQLAPERVEDWIRALSPIESPTAEDIDHEDRRTGGLLLAALVGREKTVIQELASALSGHHARGLAGMLMAWKTSQSAHSEEDEEVLMQIAMDTFGRVDLASSWRPTEVLDSFAEASRPRLLPEALRGFEEVITRTESIVRNEIAFEGFRPGGSPTLKAVLLTLLRPDPMILLDDPNLATADSEVRVRAGALVGIMSGRSRTSVSVRPPALDAALASLSASRLQPVTEGFGDRAARASVEVEEVQRDGQHDWRLRIDGVEVLTVPASTESVPSIVDADALARPEVRSRARHLADENNWTDCLLTLVDGEPFNLAFESSLQHFRLKAVGRTSVTLDIDDAAFIARVQAGDLSVSAIAELLSSQQSTEPAPPPRRRDRSPRKARPKQT